MKPHYPILDGLRGTAAMLVVVFHLLEAVFPDFADHPMHHGFLAVDFFYLLSGFVVGYAYDDRWGNMSVVQFFKIRLIRLHPLVVISIVIGAVCFLLDPYTNGIQTAGLLKLIGTMLIAFTLLPSPDVRGWNETHSLNGPCWSLLQEYIANVLYAIAGRRMNKAALWIVVVVSGVALLSVAMNRGDLATGWAYSSFWIAFIRMMFPFFAGLLLFRYGKLIRIPHAYLVCSLVLTILFFMPRFQFNGANEMNGLYEAACIIIAFPLIVAAGAGGSIGGRWRQLCDFFGAISYPIYILHYPFIYIYTMWVAVAKPAPMQIVYVACTLFVFFIGLSWAVLKVYDEPARRWLKMRIL